MNIKAPRPAVPGPGRPRGLHKGARLGKAPAAIEPGARPLVVAPAKARKTAPKSRSTALVRTRVQPVDPRQQSRRQADTIDLLGARLERELEQREELWAAILELQVSRLGNGAVDPVAVASARRMMRFRSMIREIVPGGATLAVASDGEAAWVDLPRRTAWHFPRDAAGNHTAGPLSCGLSAVAHLESLRGAGAEYLVVPGNAAGFLERLPAFRQHLDRRYRRLRDDEVGRVYELRPAVEAALLMGNGRFASLIAECEDRLGREPSILDWGTGLDLAAAHPQRNIFSCLEAGVTLPYLDETVDIVVTGSTASRDLAEARRVAGVAVARMDPVPGEGGGFKLGIDWKDVRKGAAYPSSSIIIPTYNGWRILRNCLAALRETLPAELSVEIVVVDDGSSDGTADRLKELACEEPRLRVVLSPKNGGFIAACNRGARAATGEMLVFLNNDTLPLPGWLEPLLRGLRDWPGAGAVGGKLIYPDGRLQEAGGVIFSDASGANFGRNDPFPDAPLYNYVRPVDYCSGALLATPRSLFKAMGGFDVYYAPAYYEDTDYCFRVRKRGLKVYYQPESQIVHLEGATSGTELTSGVKSCQVVNRGRFAHRWAAALKRQPSPPDRWDFGVLHGLAVRGARNGREVA